MGAERAHQQATACDAFDPTKVILRVRKLSAAALAGLLMISLAGCGNSSGGSGSSSSTTSSSAASSSASSSASGTGSTASSSAAACVTPSATASASAGSAPKDGVAGDKTGVDKVTVKQNDGGAKAPAVEFTAPVSDQALVGAKLVNPGDGDKLQADYFLTLNIAPFDAGTGKALETADYTAGQSVAFAKDNFSGGLEDVYSVLADAKVGADVVTYLPCTMTGGSSQLWVMHVSKQTKAPVKASADEVKKLKDAGDLPTVEFKDGKPSITIPQGKEAPADLIVDVIKEGDGPVATETSKVTAKYLGVTWKDGKKFDSSYDRTPTTSDFGLNQVISGWTKGLTGLKQGSTVLLSIPATLAYGETTTETQPAGPLVFVVELDKVTAAQ